MPDSTKLATKLPTANCQLPTANCAPVSAFTLIELLMVVMVIAVLFSILLSAIRTVQRHTLQTVTRGEIKNIENAWKQYFAHYQMWPTNQPPMHLIDETLARELQGIAGDQATLNRDGIVFMEFSRFNTAGRPLNAWGESGRHNEDLCSYYVMFDINGDNQLTHDEMVARPANLNPPLTNATHSLYRGVAVWSYNPEAREETRKVLGSWQQ
jgi:prepilin-type N-terminal cleavage/methylation domain-containing protein